jgi:hypothetical protein
MAHAVTSVVVLLGLFVAASCNAQSQIVVKVYNGSQLAMAVADYGATGKDTIVYMMGSMSLANVSFVPSNVTVALANALGRAAFGSGRLTIAGALGDSDSVVLDAAARNLLAPEGTVQFALGPTTKLTAANATMVEWLPMSVLECNPWLLVFCSSPNAACSRDIITQFNHCAV